VDNTVSGSSESTEQTDTEASKGDGYDTRTVSTLRNELAAGVGAITGGSSGTAPPLVKQLLPSVRGGGYFITP